HMIADAHIYDRHIPLVERLLEKEALPGPRLELDPEIKDFYAFSSDSFRLLDYQYHSFTEPIPVAI
ncbi:MAG: thymidylate synthase, partial [Bacillota bacterium]|nr:thymidylate synthase [Bacillota bacterium]